MKIHRTLVLLYGNKIMLKTWTISLFKHFPDLPVNIIQSHFHEGQLKGRLLHFLGSVP